MERKEKNVKILQFIKKNTVLCIAALAALITAVFIPPDAKYPGYIDWNTLSCLFLTLAVVCALRNIKFFTILARRLVKLAGNTRSLFLLLVVITFIGSMIIANDMALITFLPLGYFALRVAKEEKCSDQSVIHHQKRFPVNKKQNGRDDCKTEPKGNDAKYNEQGSEKQ